MSREWKVEIVKELFNVETGSTPSTKQKKFWVNGKINWITPRDLSLLKGKIYLKKSERQITEDGFKAASLTLLAPRSIIISTRAPVGYVAIIEKQATFNQGCKGLSPKDGKLIYPEFYAYFLSNKKKAFNNLSGGSTFKELSKTILENFQVLLPPLSEQKKIADVLSKADEAIEKVDEAIEKTQRLKKGLMQQLLTHGIGHKDFKETEIGRIPKAWALKRISEIVTHCQYGLSIKLSEIGRYPIIKMDNIANGYVLSKKLKYVDLDEKTFRCFRLDKGDILFNRTNSYELVGRTGIFSLDGDYVFASYLIRLKPDVEMIHPLFLNIYLIFSNRRIRRLATRAVHQANINATTLQKVKIPLPPLSEQEKIIDIVNAVYRKLELLNERKTELERIKKGLMNDLLTGRKRVKLDH